MLHGFARAAECRDVERKAFRVQTIRKMKCDVGRDCAFALLACIIVIVIIICSAVAIYKTKEEANEWRIDVVALSHFPTAGHVRAECVVRNFE